MATVTVSSELPSPSSKSRTTRLLAVGFDGATGLFGVGAVTYLVVSLSAMRVTGWVLPIIGIWTVLVCLAALPAVAVLFFSPPRVPLSQRSALVASASWFGRAVWAGVVFALSIAIGAVAGVIASAANESGRYDGSGIVLAIQATATLVLWPALQVVVAAAYVITGIRWSLDLRAIVEEQRGDGVRKLLERRWVGPLRLSHAADGLLDLVIEYGIGGLSRFALVLTLVTVAISVAVGATSWNP
jgi:hypothetical protein